MKIAKAIASIVSICSFLLYQHMLTSGYVDTMKYDMMDEMYFISITISISVFAFLSQNKGDGIFISSLTVLCSSFFAVIIIIYCYRWILFGDGSTNYYTAICFSAVITFLYIITHVIIRSTNAKS